MVGIRGARQIPQRRRSRRPARIHYTAWQFAYGAALRIALRERRPYESGRTVWEDVASRGYGMRELLAALVERDIGAIAAAMDDVWERTRAWGTPEGA